MWVLTPPQTTPSLFTTPCIKIQYTYTSNPPQPQPQAWVTIIQCLPSLGNYKINYAVVDSDSLYRLSIYLSQDGRLSTKVGKTQTKKVVDDKSFIAAPEGIEIDGILWKDET